MNNNREIIYAFIDSQNLNLAIKNDIYDKNGNLLHRGWTLDFKKFHFLLKTKYRVDKIFLFIGYKAGNENLYTYLQKIGYILIFKPILISKDKKVVKGNVDAELVLQAMVEFVNYDKAIIVSGDGDFHCLIEYLISKNKFFKLLIPNKKSFSSLLRKFAHYFAFVNLWENRLKK
ncbi:MAG: NYN domain-containing protein [Candidatus Margulisiibacteriota bacterium]|nr:NYN domain-containing protein [Candidatus Margulisiibacteriota bacterium]